MKKKTKKNYLDRIKKIDYKALFEYVKNSCIKFFKNDKHFLFYAILSLVSCSLLRLFTIGSFFNFYAILFDLSLILLIGGVSYLLKPRKQFWYLLIFSLIICLTNIINGIYFSFFNDFASFSLLESLGQATEVTGAVFEKLKPMHFIYVIFPIMFTIIHLFLRKKTKLRKEGKKRVFYGISIVGGICLFISLALLTSRDISRLTKQWNKEFIVERFGIIVYQGNDLFQTINSKLNSIFGYEEAALRFEEYYKKNAYQNINNKYSNIYKDYNVITIHMESIMTFLIGLEINGKEVTPNLNKFVKESAYFDNFYPQVSAGTSSDTEFTMNTSLLPAQRGTVNVSYYNRNYNTLEKLLAEKGYYTFSMHANKASMWNRSKMHPSLGYMDFYSQEYYDIDQTIGLGLADVSFFNQSFNIIKDINDGIKNNKESEYNNYMGTLITLTNHTPFDIEKYLPVEELFDVTYHTGQKDEFDQEIIYDYLEGDTFGSYLKSAHYADLALGIFFDYIKTHDEYNKTVFVLYGDHAAQLNRSQYAKFINYDFNTGEKKDPEDPTYIEYDYYENEIFKKTPLIIWDKRHKIKGKYSYPMGMIDVLPTIGNMLGIENKYALGHDIFNIKNDNVVVFPNGNFLTNKLYYYNSKNESKIFGEETIDANYIEEIKTRAEEILSISDDIIVYDLIERVGNREK